MVVVFTAAFLAESASAHLSKIAVATFLAVAEAAGL
jgi:hypothetical protein